ncbi:MAG: hypothetical protein KF763_03580 [Cyclobacteriaceae bacterium]|nr:hypothetical protein [Cyclobacteriaceae bacterium]
MIKRFVVLVIACLLMVEVYSQESGTQEGVSFDPTFWAHELRLDAEQRNKIEAINAEFYEHLKARPSLAQLHAYLEERQELILGTFHPRQKRKWEKIVSSL